MKSLLLSAIAILVMNTSSFGEEANLRIIVNPSNKTTKLTAKEISDFYFKRTRYWPNGTKVRFFDQRQNSAAKKLFLEKVLKKTQREIELFWIGEKNFNGQGAPIEAPNDDMVISSVAALPGSIGYIIDGEAELNRVKQVTIEGTE